MKKTKKLLTHPPDRRRPLSFGSVKKEIPYLVMLLPVFLFVFLFVLLPLIQGFPISFMQWDGFSDNKVWVGFDNYIKIFQDKFVKQSVFNTLEFTIYEVVGCNVIGLVLAVWLKKSCRSNNVCRTLIFMPHVISLLLSAYMIRYIFNEVYNVTGIVNVLGMPSTVMAALSFIAIWRDSGYCMIIYIAALQGVDESLYEVARIEGALGMRHGAGAGSEEVQDGVQEGAASPPEGDAEDDVMAASMAEVRDVPRIGQHLYLSEHISIL